MTFYVTFGQKSPFRNGWVRVEANDIKEAYEKVEYAIGKEWSNMYRLGDLNLDLYPKGQLGETLK